MKDRLSYFQRALHDFTKLGGQFQLIWIHLDTEGHLALKWFPEISSVFLI